MSVLKLSTLWAIEDIRNKVIAELSEAKMDAMDRVLNDWQVIWRGTLLVVGRMSHTHTRKS